jgi:hypothetical protein
MEERREGGYTFKVRMEERAEGERVLNAKKPPSPALTPEGDSGWGRGREGGKEGKS